MTLMHFIVFYLVQGHCFIDFIDPASTIMSKFCAAEFARFYGIR